MLAMLDQQARQFRDDVLAGLSAPIPAVAARWLYDQRGSELFDRITRLPAYYPTRTEMGIFEEIMPDVAARVPKGAVVVEFGAGSQTKTPILLIRSFQIALCRNRPMGMSPSSSRLIRCSRLRLNSAVTPASSL